MENNTKQRLIGAGIALGIQTVLNIGAFVASRFISKKVCEGMVNKFIDNDDTQADEEETAE